MGFPQLVDKTQNEGDLAKIEAVLLSNEGTAESDY